MTTTGALERMSRAQLDGAHCGMCARSWQPAKKHGDRVQQLRVNGSVGRPWVERNALIGPCRARAVTRGAASERLAVAMWHAGVLRERRCWYVKTSSRLPGRFFFFGAGAVFINTSCVYPSACSTQRCAWFRVGPGSPENRTTP
jgi:hypothetical protein